jgi:hypothetical protein
MTTTEVRFISPYLEAWEWIDQHRGTRGAHSLAKLPSVTLEFVQRVFAAGVASTIWMNSAGS